MYLLWGFINTLQMILYLPMLEVNFPANVKFMYSILLSVASLDLIPSEYTTQLVFDFSVDLDKPYSNILEELGYETHNSILNLGSIFTYFVVFVVGIVFIYVIKISGIQKNWIIKLYKVIKNLLIFNGFILLFMEGCMEVVISAYVNLSS